MAIEYIIEALLVIGFMLSVLVVCKWVEEIKRARKEAQKSGQSVWKVLKNTSHGESLGTEPASSGVPVVYLKVSNPKLNSTKSSVRSQVSDMAVLKKAANSE